MDYAEPLTDSIDLTHDYIHALLCLEEPARYRVEVIVFSSGGFLTFREPDFLCFPIQT